MNRRIIALCAALPLLFAGFALAEPVPEYTFPGGEGVVFNLDFLPGGDILHRGSYGRQNADGLFCDSIIRSRPDGSEVWSLDLPYPPQEHGVASQFLALSNGNYMAVHALDEGDLRAFFLDAGKGLTKEMPLPDGQQRYFAIEGGILEADVPRADTLRLRWLDFDGQEVMEKTYNIQKVEDCYLYLLETEGALYLLAQHPRDRTEAISTLVKIGRDGLLRWEQTERSPGGFGTMLSHDGEGGIIVMGENGMIDRSTQYPYTARRIDAQGNTVWTDEIDVGEWIVGWEPSMDAGIRMLWETDDTFRLMTLDGTGMLAEGQTYAKPKAAEESCWISGLATDEKGREWAYYITILEVDDYTADVRPYLAPLDTFLPLEKE